MERPSGELLRGIGGRQLVVPRPCAVSRDADLVHDDIAIVRSNFRTRAGLHRDVLMTRHREEVGRVLANFLVFVERQPGDLGALVARALAHERDRVEDPHAFRRSLDLLVGQSEPRLILGNPHADRIIGHAPAVPRAPSVNPCSTTRSRSAYCTMCGSAGNSTTTPPASTTAAR